LFGAETNIAIGCKSLPESEISEAECSSVWSSTMISSKVTGSFLVLIAKQKGPYSLRSPLRII
jgi:hypothetical protein